MTFFESDVWALLSWHFADEDAARILRLPPQAEDTTVPGAGHLLAATHPGVVAGLVVDFLRRHPRET